MSFKHEVKCNACGRIDNLESNGEHYLPPDDWYRLYCDHAADVSSVHICDKCYRKTFKHLDKDGGGKDE